MAKICLNCEENEAVKYSKYSNGNFCCRECARAYSTKNDRKNISKKVSKTLTNTGHEDVEKTCPTCGKKFTLPYKRRFRTYCSPKCSNNAQTVKDKISASVGAVRRVEVDPKTLKETREQSEARRKEARKIFDENNITPLKNKEDYENI